MKTFLLLYIALLCALGFISQSIHISPIGDMIFIFLNIVCIPIITAYALKLYFTLSIKLRGHN